MQRRQTRHVWEHQRSLVTSRIFWDLGWLQGKQHLKLAFLGLQWNLPTLNYSQHLRRSTLSVRKHWNAIRLRESSTILRPGNQSIETRVHQKHQWYFTLKRFFFYIIKHCLLQGPDTETQAESTPLKALREAVRLATPSPIKYLFTPRKSLVTKGHSKFSIFNCLRIEI